MKNVTLLIVGLTMLSGCTDKFSCHQFPESGCQPVSAVYEKTNDGFYDYRKNLYKEGDGDKKRDGEDVKVNIGATRNALNVVNPGDPLMTKPVIVRVLFNPWVDKNRTLHAGGFHYVKVKDSTWTLEQ